MASYRATNPVPNPTESFWQKEQESHLRNYHSETFPAEVDVLIIGSGLTGALVAYNLLSRPGPRPSLVMLEARTVASGATGRNGGHIKPDVYHGFAEYQKFHGTEMALKQCHFERANLRETTNFIQQNGLTEEVDLVLCRSANIFSTAQAWTESLASFNAFKAAGGNVDGIVAHDASEARKLFRIPECHGAFSFDAASLWPYKLTIAILARSIELGLCLHTNTPVTGITKDESSSWVVSAASSSMNGQFIKAKTIVHATNGYVSQLLPEFDGRVVPLKGHLAAISPTKAYLEQPWPITGSVFSNVDFEYLIQRRSAGKHFIIGGGDIAAVNLTAPIGDCDDSNLDKSVADYLRTFPARRFEGWAEEVANGQRPEAPMVWSGIMGLSRDAFPFVGELPGKKGQFVAAGFHGHGMARIFLTVRNLCRVMCREALEDGIPEVYFDLERRMKEGFSLADLGLDG